MSAPETGRRASFSSAGYEDGFGRRALVFDREPGTTIERLTLKPEFGLFEASLAVHAARLAATPVRGIVGPERVHRLQPRGPLVADSALPAGDRLSDLLDAAAEGDGDQAAGGIDAALGFLLAALPIVHEFHMQHGCVHGAIGPGRLFITRDGGVALLDAIYADALRSLALPRRRLWTEFTLACPPAAGPARFTPGGDIAQVSLAALMILLGRAPAHSDFPDRLPAAIAEASEIAEIRGGSHLAVGLRSVLELALPAGSVPSAAAVNQEVRRLVESTVEIASCRTALAAFADAARQLPLPPPKLTLVPTAATLGETRPLDIAPIVWSPLEVRIEVPEPPENPAPDRPAESVVQPPERATAPSELATGAVDVACGPPESPAEKIDAPVAPIAVSGATVQSSVEPVEAGDSEAAVPERCHEAPAVEPAQAPIPPPDAPPSKTGKSGRGRRARAKEREQERQAAAPALAHSPLPTLPALPPPPQPVFPQPIITQPVFSPPPSHYPGGGQGQASPYQESAGRVWQPDPVAAPPVPVVPVAAVPPAPAAKPIGIRLKSDSAGAPIQSVRRAPPSAYEHEEFPRAYRQPARRRWPLGPVVALIVVAAAGIYGARGYLPAAGPAAAASDRSEVAPVRTTGTLSITSIPSGARVLIDGQRAGETPLTLDSVAPGRRTVTVTSGGGTAHRVVDIAAGDSLELSIPVYSGWLAVEAPIVLEVSQGGRVLGTTEQSRLLLPPGRHTISVSNRTLGYKASHTVTIEPGEERRLSLTPSSEVNLNASPWAEVWIDGRHVGETPLAGLAIPLGTREIVFKHPQYGQRRLTPTIRHRDPAAISVDMTKPNSP